MEADEERQVVVGTIGLVDDLVVEALGYDDATVVLAAVEGIVEDGSGEGTEDVAGTEVYPGGFVVRLLGYCCDVKLWKLISFGFPFGSVEAA